MIRLKKIGVWRETMERLKELIREQGVISNEVLRVDAFLSHQVDPVLVMEMGREFARRFREENITKVLTIESSGISVAFATALELGVPMVFARRKRTLMTEADTYCERVPSFTKGIVTDILVAKSLLSPDDRVLLVDDIIANGDAVRGLLRIIERADCRLAGLGIVLEKSFQAGARTIREQGIRVESLVRIRKINADSVEFE
jgi:xanthine phosphoribosyltransferase